MIFRKLSVLVLAILGLAITSNTASAYIGPGVGAGVIGSVLGVIFGFFMILFALIWYPIKRLYHSIKSAKTKTK